MICFMKKLLFAVVAGTAAVASAFDLALGLNGDVRLGEKGPDFGIRIYQEGWNGTLAGLARDLAGMAKITGQDVKSMTRLFDMHGKPGKCA